MANREKLEVLKAFLRENNISFKEKCKCSGKKVSLYIGKYRICVRISNEYDQSFYDRVKYHFHPLFIRESETAEFVVEKMQNLIIELMKREHEKLSR